LSSALVLAQNVASWGAASLPGMGSPTARSFPAESGRITGTVISIDGRRQCDVLVQVHDFSSHSIVASAYTDQDGSFAFDTVVARRRAAYRPTRVDVRAEYDDC